MRKTSFLPLTSSAIDIRYSIRPLSRILHGPCTSRISFELLFIICAKWTEWMAEILFSFNVCLSVCLFVCLSVCPRSGQVSQTSLKRLKQRTSNLTCMFPGDVRTWPLKFSKSGVARVKWPPKFWGLNANSSKTVKASLYGLQIWRECFQGQSGHDQQCAYDDCFSVFFHMCEALKQNWNKSVVDGRLK